MFVCEALRRRSTASLFERLFIALAMRAESFWGLAPALFLSGFRGVCDGLWALACGLRAPAAAAVLADGFGVGSGLGFAVGDGGDDEDEAGGTEGEDDPEGPGDTAAVLGFGLGDGLDEDVGAVAVWACHGVASFSMRGAGGWVEKKVDFELKGRSGGLRGWGAAGG